MALSTLLATFLCTIVLPILLFLVTLKLWEVYMIRSRDRSCPSPLPPGSMGLPFIGETLQLILQVKAWLRKHFMIHNVHTWIRMFQKTRKCDLNFFFMAFTCFHLGKQIPLI